MKNTKTLVRAHHKRILCATGVIAVAAAIAIVSTFQSSPIEKEISELRQQQVGYSLLEKEAKEEWKLAKERLDAAEEKAQEARNELTALENRIQSLVKGEVIEDAPETAKEGKEPLRNE